MIEDVIRIDIPESIELDGNAVEIDIPMEIDDVYLNLDYDETVVLSRSYNDLEDKPRLNGETIVGDMVETDPTVPNWAKSPTPPEYTAEDVGAVPTGALLGAADFEYMWDTTEI